MGRRRYRAVAASPPLGSVVGVRHEGPRVRHRARASVAVCGAAVRARPFAHRRAARGQMRGKRAWRSQMAGLSSRPSCMSVRSAIRSCRKSRASRRSAEWLKVSGSSSAGDPVGVHVHPPEAALEEDPVGGFGEVQLGVDGAGRAVAPGVGVELLDDVAQRPGEVENRHPAPGRGQLAVRLRVGEVDIAAEEVMAQRAHIRGPVVRLRRIREAAGEGVAEVDHALMVSRRCGGGAPASAPPVPAPALPRYTVVSTRGPSSVTATVCSKWAAREASVVRRVQPSLSS